MADLMKQYAESIQIGYRTAEEAAAIALTATDLKEQGNFFAAAEFYLAAHSAAWGIKPHELCHQFLFEALDCLILYLNSNPSDVWKELLALKLLMDHSKSTMYRGDTAISLANLCDSAIHEYIAIINRISVDDNLRIAMMINGFYLTGQLDGEWIPTDPGCHISTTDKRWDNKGVVVHSMPSVFDLLIRIKEYRTSYDIVGKYPESFTSFGLKGWASACKGFIDNDTDAFFQAAENFAFDTYENKEKTRASWNAVNVSVWAPYFKSRGHLSALASTPENAIDRLRKSHTLTTGRGGFVVADVNRHFNIIGAVNGLIDRNEGQIASALNNCQMDIKRFSGNQGFVYAYEFISRISELSKAKHTEEWIPHLMELLKILDRIPDISDAEKRNIERSLNVAVINSLAGFENGWEYRLLSDIKDERILHRVMLKVFRGEAETPYYSHIRHGPIEYGKDLVICRNINSKKINYCYSFKVGELKKSQWNKEVRPQLEEIFQVKFESPELNEDVLDTIGVLLWNDHLSPYVEPIVRGWLDEQKNVHGRQFELMNIDSVVNYIKDNKLSGLLREALRDEGIV